MERLNNNNFDEIEREKISNLAEEYEFRKSTIEGYYETIMLYPFVQNGTVDKKWECLETIVQDRFSQKEFDASSNPAFRRSLTDTICDSLYRVYEDEAIHYLNEEFLRTHEIEERNYDRQYVYEHYNRDERQYHGYN